MRNQIEDDLHLEGVCRGDEYRCSYGKCIPRNHRCDGEHDCKDGSDEKYKCKGSKCVLTKYEEQVFCGKLKDISILLVVQLVR